MKKIGILFVSVLILTGCSQRITDFTMITSKNIDLDRMASFKRGSERVIGEDAKHIIIFIPTGVPNAKEALDRAIESVPGAVALMDGVMTHKWFYIPYIYGKSWYVVEGTALIDPKLQSSVEKTRGIGKYSFIFLDSDGSAKKMKNVSKLEFERAKDKKI